MWGRRDRQSRIDFWLSLFGLELDFLGSDEFELPEFYMVSGKSPRSTCGHAVVYSKGVLAHDPHYSGLGIVGEPSTTWYLKALPGTQVHPSIPKSAYLVG